MSPLRAMVALLGILTAWLGSPQPVATPEAAGPTLPAPVASGATNLLADLDRLEQRIEAHHAFRAGRESWLDVGVSPAPPPRKWASQ